MTGHIKLSDKSICLLCIILSGIIFFVDVLTPVGVITPMLYLIVIFLALLSSNLRLALIFGVLVSILGFMGIFVSFDGTPISRGVINRILVFCAAWTIIVIGRRYKLTRERVWILASMVNSSHDAIIGKTLNGKIISWNKGAQDIFGYQPDEIVGKSVNMLIPENKHYEEQDLLSRLKKGEKFVRYETIRKRKDGNLINVALTVSPIQDMVGNYIGASTIVRNITDLKEHQQKLKNEIENLEDNVEGLESTIDDKNLELVEKNKILQGEILERKKKEKQLRELSAYLTSIREQERSTMAREVHDELGQFLTAIKMDLSWLDDNLPEDEEKALKRVSETSELIDTTISSVQRIVAKLRPSILDDLGIIEAIKWQAKEFQKRSEITCRVSIKSNGVKLHDDASTGLFRIFQESLTNIARHAQATHVDIEVDKDRKNLFLKIKDNGKGISKDKLCDKESFGLMGMRERALMFSGKIEINGAQGTGTTVGITMPLKGNGEAK